MKTYRGGRVDGNTVVTVNHEPLPLRLDLYNHSPTGFNWGYGGSGPAQLALAILADHFNDDKKALKHYQDFKWKVIAHLNDDLWFLSSDQIDSLLNRDMTMYEIKFRFAFKKNGDIFFVYYTLDELIQGKHLQEEEPIAHGYELIAKDQYSGFKDKNGKELYCNGDICATPYSNYTISRITVAHWILDQDKMNDPMRGVSFINTIYKNKNSKEL